MATLDEVSALPSEYPAWMLDRLSADRLGLVSGHAAAAVKASRS
jgi:hypothetical protein